MKITPLNINMEPKNGGLEHDVPFQLVDFLGSMLIFRGVNEGIRMGCNDIEAGI